jgi:hypothetical protein
MNTSVFIEQSKKEKYVGRRKEVTEETGSANSSTDSVCTPRLICNQILV